MAGRACFCVCASTTPVSCRPKDTSSACSRRSILSAGAGVVTIPWQPKPVRAEEEAVELTEYRDAKGFAVSVPATWREKEKPGASVLFADPVSKFNQLGVSVEPVKIDSLGEYGSVDDVADRLLRSERAKDSTLDAQINRAYEEQGRLSGNSKYVLEYTLKNVYGTKRVATAALISSRKLFLLNAQGYLTNDGDADSRKAALLSSIVSSFDVLPRGSSSS